MNIRKLSKVILYDEGTTEKLDFTEIASYVRDTLRNVNVEVKPYPLTPPVSEDLLSGYAKRFAISKIDDPLKVWTKDEPLYGEVDYEKRRIKSGGTSTGILYEGIELQQIFGEMMQSEERNLQFVHIFFTSRLFATFDDANKRYHARVSILGVPSIISITGLVEAPAKPREFYLLKQQYDTLGKDVTALKDTFKGRFIDYEDERLTEIIKGYVMQAVFYSLVDDPFCEDSKCRLYNAHWQKEAIFAQVGSEYEFCQYHADVLNTCS